MKSLLIPLILSAGLAQADCTAPAELTEQTICGSAVLLRLEAQMQAALEGPAAEDQQSWLASRRRACGARLSCIASMTRQRVRALQQATTPDASPVWTARENPLGEGDLTMTGSSLRIAGTDIPIRPVPGQTGVFYLPQKMPFPADRRDRHPHSSRAGTNGRVLFAAKDAVQGGACRVSDGV